MKPTDITREEIAELVTEAHGQGKSGKSKEDHVKQKLKLKYSGLEGLKVVRNGQVYDALDYLMGDLESYGSSA
jgi:hypothetical protein